MSLLTWLRGRASRTAAAGESPRSHGAENAARSPTATVPDGGLVTVFNGRPLHPGVQVTTGGCPIAGQGALTDRMDHDLDVLLTAVREHLADGHTPFYRVPRSALRTSDLFETSTALDSLSAIVWALDPRPFFTHGGERRLLKLLLFLRELAITRQITPILYVCPAEPAASVPAFVEVLNRLGLPCRTCAEDGAFVLAVHRPDGVVVTGLAGTVHEAPEATRQEFNALFGGRVTADGTLAPNDERAQLMYLQSLLQERPGLAPVYLDWAPVLRDAIQDMKNEVPDAYPRMLKVLRDRHVSFQHIPNPQDPSGRAVCTVGLEGHTAIELFPDSIAIQSALLDFGMDVLLAPRASIPIHELLGWLANDGLGILLWINQPEHKTGDPGLGALVLPQDVRAWAAEVSSRIAS